MPIRIANIALTLHRGGGTIDVKAGATVDLTTEELEQIRNLNPNALRKPIVETEAVVQADTVVDTPASVEAQTKDVGKGGKNTRGNAKDAKADAADDEEL